MPTTPAYKASHIKRNTVTDAAAMRTIYPEDGDMAWLSLTPSSGSKYFTTEQVSGSDWYDLYIPEPDGEVEPESPPA